MNRRGFLTRGLSSAWAAVGLGAAAGGSLSLGLSSKDRGWQTASTDAATSLNLPSEALVVRRPGMDAGHAFRDRPLSLSQSSVWRQAQPMDVVILGSGLAALACAWELERRGIRNILMLEGPSRYGNADFGQLSDWPSSGRLNNAHDASGLRYPRGAHYLPLPGPRLGRLRELLADLGILESSLESPRPHYRESDVVQAPQERMWHPSGWSEKIGPLPTTQQAREQWDRFEKLIAGYASAYGRDGRKVFTIPVAESSLDPQWRALDRVTFSAWLDQQGFTDGGIRWYLDYCCRDDYGAEATIVSAWAGLHYFCAREGQGADLDPHAVLTWPNGLGHLAQSLAQRLRHTTVVRAMALKVGEPTAPQQRRRVWAQGLTDAADIRQRSARFGYSSDRVASADDAVANALGEQPPLGPESTAPPQELLAFDARFVICCAPLHVAARLIPEAFADDAESMPPRASWMVANFILDRFPSEPEDHPLAWDNVVYQSEGLGWVVASHQWIRQAKPSRTIFTSYRALGPEPSVLNAMARPSNDIDWVRLAADDLDTAYRGQWRRGLCAAEITLIGHAMATPTPGFLTNPLLLKLRRGIPGVSFAHSDLAGYSVCEEAIYWGLEAADQCLHSLPSRSFRRT